MAERRRIFHGYIMARIAEVKKSHLRHAPTTFLRAAPITVRCDGCIAFHVHYLIQAGASKAEIAEAVSMANLMGGRPSVVYGIEAMQALSHLQAAST